MSIAISVIVPTFKRKDLLSACLNQLAPGAQSLDFANYEVIVSDDSGQLKNLVQEHYPWAKWVKGPGSGPACNRNFGAGFAQGKWLAFIDDDCLADRHWLEVIVKHAQENCFDVIEGQTEIPDKIDSPFAQGVENIHGGCFWSCNLAVKREVFQQLGGFDCDFQEAGGEDMEFAWRIKQHGLKTVFVPQALVLHPVRQLNFKALLWRTFLIRWLLLYHLKTQADVNLQENIWRVWLRLIWLRTLSLMRDNWHLLRRFDSQNWRSKLFWQLWNTLTFPIVLPYLLYWEWKFRQLLRASREP